MSINKFCILIFLLILPFQAQSNVDSLLSLLAVASEDTSKANILNGLAAEFQDSDYDKSLKYAEESLLLSQKLGYRKGEAKALSNYGIVLKRSGKPEEALKAYYKCLEINEELKNKQGQANSYNLIGNYFSDNGQFDEAIINYDKCLTMSQELGDGHGITLALNNIGVIHAMRGNTEQALVFFVKSMRMDSVAGRVKNAAKTLGNIGLIHANMGNLKSAIYNYERALEVIRKIGIDAELGNVFNNLGTLYEMIGEFEKAIKYYEEYYSIGKSVGDIRIQALATTNLAGAYNNLADYEHAKKYAELSVRLNEEISHKEGIAQSKYTLAVVVDHLGESERAGKLFEESFEVASAINHKQVMTRASAELGEWHYKNKRNRQAEANLLRSLQIAEEIGYTEEISLAARYLRKIYKEKGVYEKALFYEELFHKMKDSTDNDSNKGLLAELETKYEAAKKDLEIETLKRESLESDLRNERQSSIRNALLIGILGLFLCLGLGFYALRQKQTANSKLKIQKAELAHQKTKITDSIHYASRIQSAMLPPEQLVSSTLKDYFILFKPRDIVSGDFYWLKEINGRIFLAAADCTGHGVPGAFMSLLGIAFLNDIIARNPTWMPGQILDALRDQIKKSLHQQEGKKGSKDGMDMAFCIIEKESKMLHYAGAYNPFWLFRRGVLQEIKATRNPVAWFIKEKNFENHSIELEENDVFYIFSDGFQDQIGGDSRRKFLTKNFRKLITEIHTAPMPEQHTILEQKLSEWQGEHEQIDDICIIGVKISS